MSSKGISDRKCKKLKQLLDTDIQDRKGRREKLEAKKLDKIEEKGND